LSELTNKWVFKTFFSFTFEGLLSENDDLDFEIIPIEAVRDHFLGGWERGSGGRAPY
jgi:hypothetical protein